MKLVLRLLGADGALLGWCAHVPKVRGDGCLRADGPIYIRTEQRGKPAVLSVHWTDVNVETRVSVTLEGELPANYLVRVFGGDEVLIQVGEPANGLPPVTVAGSVEIAIPVGMLGARSEP